MQATPSASLTTPETLNQLRVGESAIVARVCGTGALKQRLLDMGLTKGVTIRVIKAAPLGDPIEISVRGYELSLRKKEGACIQIVR